MKRHSTPVSGQNAFSNYYSSITLRGVGSLFDMMYMYIIRGIYLINWFICV